MPTKPSPAKKTPRCSTSVIPPLAFGASEASAPALPPTSASAGGATTEEQRSVTRIGILATAVLAFQEALPAAFAYSPLVTIEYWCANGPNAFRAFNKNAEELLTKLRGGRRKQATYALRSLSWAASNAGLLTD